MVVRAGRAGTDGSQITSGSGLETPRLGISDDRDYVKENMKDTYITPEAPGVHSWEIL